MDNGIRPNAFQATEEELAASEYELSEMEALILHLNDRKQLLLERMGKLNDAIQLKENHQQVYHNGLSAGKPTTHIDDTERNGTYNRRK
jgi:hypothetical protein